MKNQSSKLDQFQGHAISKPQENQVKGGIIVTDTHAL